jgi:hypothetical protein
MLVVGLPMSLWTMSMVHGVSPVRSADIRDTFSSVGSFPIGLEDSQIEKYVPLHSFSRDELLCLIFEVHSKVAISKVQH